MPNLALKPEVTFCVQGVISPLLANIYLHYAYDLWVEQWRRRHARGAMIVVRYADDTVVGFEHRSDAERFLAELRIRMAKFALELHPGKTRLIEFGRQAVSDRAARGAGKPKTFRHPGLHPYLFAIEARWVPASPPYPTGPENGEAPGDQGGPPATLAPGHSRARGLAGRGGARFLRVPMRCPPTHVPSRRSATMSSISGDAPCAGVVSGIVGSGNCMEKLAERWLPKPRTSHPWPAQRFRVKHPRWEPLSREFRTGVLCGGRSSNGRPFPRSFDKGTHL